MARRGRGEGTIRHRASDGRWEATVTLGTQRKSFYGKTRREVSDKLRAAQRDYEQGQYIGESRQTVEQYLTSWLEVKRPNVKDATYRAYAMQLRVHVTPIIGQVRLSSLTAQHVQRVISTCLEAGLAGKTAGEVYGVLHQALRAAERLGLVARDVSERVSRPRSQKGKMHPLSREEANRFLAAAAGHFLEPLFRLALTTGMREGELLALKWRDVDLEQRQLSVVASLYWRDYEPVYSTPKTQGSRRQIAIPAQMVDALRAQRQWQRTQRLRVGAAWQGDRYDAVFSDELGFPLHRARVVGQFLQTLRAADLPRVRFHDLRHTFATLQLANGVHPKIVSEMLGHATVSITLDLYSHVLPHKKEDAARAIGDVLHW